MGEVDVLVEASDAWIGLGDGAHRLVQPLAEPIVQGATDGLPEDLAGVTPEHWSTFPPQHPLIIHIAAILLFLLWMLSALGNGLVVFIFLCTKSLRTPVR